MYPNDKRENYTIIWVSLNKSMEDKNEKEAKVDAAGVGG